MVELQSCTAIAEISAELSRERQRNEELLQIISLLEIQLKQRDDQLNALSNVQANSSSGEERRFRKFKKQKSETITEKVKNVHCLQLPSQGLNLPSTDTHENRLVNWMSMDDLEIFECEKSKYDNLLADSDDTNKELNEDLDKNDMEHINREDTSYVNSLNKQNGLLRFEKYDTSEILTSAQKKSAKVAFCPKEVNRIIESEELLLKNAHSHTIRKILVFASLGICHGSEEMYELNFNHFSIFQKGEPYLSPKNPGEHVVYENPGIRRKVFYPNMHNPTLCPVIILEEEKSMRPSDFGCPSFLFLCIKYGGTTRDLPQNEYVRQRMGRNKLNSFGPLICRIAMLANIRSGSFFFKALGITLLFMAGFSDDLVRKETKYKSLDLLQKYYRQDEDVKGEALFLSIPATWDYSQKLSRTVFSSKAKGKKRKMLDDSAKLAKNANSTPSTSSPITQFGLMGYTIPPQSMKSQSPITYPNFQPHFPNFCVPMLCWPPSNASVPPSYPYSYSYRPFPCMGNYYSHPLYSHGSSDPLIPKQVKGTGKNDSDSNSSSSSTAEAIEKS